MTSTTIGQQGSDPLSQFSADMREQLDAIDGARRIQPADHWGPLQPYQNVPWPIGDNTYETDQYVDNPTTSSTGKQSRFGPVRSCDLYKQTGRQQSTIDADSLAGLQFIE